MLQTFTRRTVLLGMGGLALGAFGRRAVAGTERLRVTHHAVHLGLERPRRIAHLTDLHVGWTSSESCLNAAIEVADQANPDLVVLTGDYVNHSTRRLRDLETWIERLERPTVATLGNHDHWSGAGLIQGAFEKRGIPVLRNEALSVDGLQVVGIDDGRTRRDAPERAFHGVTQPETALVLAHYPPSAYSIAQYGGRLVLSGHTHGGHVRVPRVTEAIARKTGHALLEGWYEIEGAQLYVNAGLGHDGLRVGREAWPEVAVFDLT